MSTKSKRLFSFSCRATIFLGVLCVPQAHAESYLRSLEARDALIGELQYVRAERDETLLDVARRFGVGYEEIIQANSHVNRWIPGEDTSILIPSFYVLPDAPAEGIVLNLAELRLYYFPQNHQESRRVYTFPISIGRMDWKTPLGRTHIVGKERDPAWYPPASIKAEHASEGDYLEDVIPGGAPENPLGHYALRLGIRGYLIHGTDESKQFGIGMRVTHGCVRMYPEDIEELFSMVSVGTPVTFVDQAVKVAWDGPNLYLEAHAPLEEDEEEFELYFQEETINQAIRLIQEHLGVFANVSSPQPDLRRFGTSVINSEKIERVIRTGNGVPEIIAQTRSQLPPAKGYPFNE